MSTFRKTKLFLIIKTIKDLLYYLVNGIIKIDINPFLCYLSASLRLDISLGKPVLLSIEPANICNLNCDVCETGQDLLERKKYVMKLEEYERILSQFDSSLKEVFLYFMGEPFINPDIYKMIRFTADRGIYTSICTNGDILDPEELADSGISEISFQIAGMDQETHSKYRRGSDLKTVLNNLETLIRLRNERKRNMRIELGFIVMSINEDQIREAEDYAAKAGVDRINIIPTCARDAGQAEKLLPANKDFWIYDPLALEKGDLVPKNSFNGRCEWIYSTVTVVSNGDIVPCCRDVNGHHILGNILNENIYDVWNSGIYKQFRRSVKKNELSGDICRLCEGYSQPRSRKAGHRF